MELKEYEHEGMSRIDSYLDQLRKRTRPKPGALVWVATSVVTDALSGSNGSSSAAASVTKGGENAAGDDPDGQRLQSGRVTSILADGSVEILLDPSRRECFGSQPSRIVVPADSVTLHVDPEKALMDLSSLEASTKKKLASSPHRKVPLPPPVVPLWSHHDHVLFVQSYARYVDHVQQECSADPWRSGVRWCE